jgi:hypothetical protein
MKDYLSIGRKIFAGIKYEAAEENIKRLAGNMDLLERKGLSKLNKRLIEGGRGIWATIAEHNFAVILVSQHCSTISISYEPPGLKRPPDFKVEIGGITYWIQMKDLSKLERENRQNKIIQKIKASAKEIKVGKFFSCMLSDDFKESCLPELIMFIKDKASSAFDENSFLFTGENNQNAKIEFWSAKNIELSELTLGSSGDLEILEITGMDREQIKQSLLNAAGAFNWEVDHKNVNLIVLEADNKKDIDICDALFGTEYEIFDNRGHRWNRKNNGFFREPDFTKKVAGVISIKRKRERVNENEIFPLSSDAAELAKHFNMTREQVKKTLEWKDPGPIAGYSQILYMNNKFENLLVDIKRLLSFDEVVYYNMRTPMGKGNFILS